MTSLTFTMGHMPLRAENINNGIMEILRVGLKSIGFPPHPLNFRKFNFNTKHNCCRTFVKMSLDFQ